MARAFVGLGSNLGDREVLLRDAVAALGAVPGVEVRRVSTLRETDPVGYVDQPRFLNGAAELDTTLPPRELLAVLLQIERRLGRDRAAGPRYGPRTVDLDLLLYDDLALAEPDLELPHPRAHERLFVLEPLAELDPALVLPGRGGVQTLISELR